MSERIIATATIHEVMDHMPQIKQEVEVILENDGLALVLQLKGFGCAGCVEGVGGQVLVEVHNGKLRAMIWGDINREDPTDICDLEGAREIHRVDPPE